MPKMPIDLDELERLHKAATPGPWKMVGSDQYTFTAVILPPDFPQTPLVGRFRDEQDAAYIVAACNSLPELIAENRTLQERAQMRQELVEQYEQDIARFRQKVRELERQKVELAELAIYGNGCFDCPLEDVCLYKEELVRDSAVCSRLLIEWVEQAAKEAE